jgi:hypothetical protein
MTHNIALPLAAKYARLACESVQVGRLREGVLSSSLWAGALKSK